MSGDSDAENPEEAFFDDEAEQVIAFQIGKG